MATIADMTMEDLKQLVYEVGEMYRSISVPLHGKKVKKVYTKQALDLLDELFPEEETNDDGENA